MKIKILTLSLVAMLFSCSCKTVPVKPPLPVGRQALVTQVENVCTRLNADFKNEKMDATATISQTLFATSKMKPDTAIVVLKIKDFLVATLYMETQEGGWRSLGEAYTSVEGTLSGRRQGLMANVVEFEASLTKEGLNFKRQEFLWATIRNDANKDAALMFYEINGVNTGFAAFFVEGGWVVIPETFE